MLSFVRGDMFKTSCEAVVNPCNCVGVAGKGISLMLKQMAPSNYDAYCDLCHLGLMKPGDCAVVETIELGPNIKYVINFPTKNHWRDPSQMDYIRKGLHELVSAMRSFNIHSVAIPALGCGCGMLEWQQVKTTITEILEFLGHDGLIFEIYEPLQ